MKSLPRFVLAFITSTLFASAVFACTCAENSARSDFRRAKAVFVGKVVSNQDASDGVKITFTVEKQWKGHQQKAFTALWEGPGPCGGFLFENGRTYLVYARGDKMWVDTACDRTAKIEQAHDDIQKLNSAWFRFYARLIPFSFPLSLIAAQKSSGPPNGTLIVDGGGATEPIVRRFVELAGGAQARIVVIATAPSSIRFGPENVILDPDWPRDRKEWQQYRDYLKSWFGVDQVEIIHTRDRHVADSDVFVAPLNTATGVYLAPGNAGRLADAYLNTRTLTALKGLLNRGGVVFGSSAGAIIQGSFTVRGRPDKPLLMAPGKTEGFGFLTNVAINPHLTSAKRDAELVNVVDAHPELLGIGIDDDAALLVRRNLLEVIGAGRVAIYDNIRREGSWYYWLKPGDKFDLSTWTKIH